MATKTPSMVGPMTDSAMVSQDCRESRPNWTNKTHPWMVSMLICNSLVAGLVDSTLMSTKGLAQRYPFDFQGHRPQPAISIILQCGIVYTLARGDHENWCARDHQTYADIPM